MIGQAPAAPIAIGAGRLRPEAQGIGTRGSRTFINIYEIQDPITEYAA